jgi:hypothetical protein
MAKFWPKKIITWSKLAAYNKVKITKFNIINKVVNNVLLFVNPIAWLNVRVIVDFPRWVDSWLEV